MIDRRTYKPVPYYILTYLITYALWFTGAYMSHREWGDGPHMILMLAGLIVPFVLSLVFIFASGKPVLKRLFFNRLVNIHLIAPETFPFIFLIMPLSVLLSIVLSLPFGGTISQFHFAEGFSFSAGFVPVVLLLFLASTFEELGWRGYAFDSLESKHTFFTASVIFGMVWSFWHFPLLFVKGSYQYEIFHQNPLYALNFFVSIIPLGVIISWVCIKNGKSILAAVLFHFIINMSQEVSAISPATKCIQTGVLTMIAVALIMVDRELFFSRKHFVPKRSQLRSTE
ncbi:MAG: CPBP family intramembrane metalloprotease [Chitinivibrionales bacterium]|nr:CPBP family intramembrane metalloprotease [Chitinivibrionales bacterium]